MFSASRTIALSLAGTAAAVAAIVGSTASASAYETGYSNIVPLYAFDAASAPCASSEKAARMTQPAVPEYPVIALDQGIEGRVLVIFSLTRDGNVTDASIEQTSGNRWLDSAALSAVKKSRYAPAIHECSNAGGTYGVEVGFATQELESLNVLIQGPGGRPRIK